MLTRDCDRPLFMPGTKTKAGTIIAVESSGGERMYYVQNGPNEFARYPQDVMEKIMEDEGAC